MNILSLQIAGLFSKAMTYEVVTTPKPGLVDRWHNGSHTDMNINLFMESIGALFPYYVKSSLLGIEAATIEDISALFPRLRKLGQKAEREMYIATGNINTHKGLIFSGGILCAAAACSYIQNSCFDFHKMQDFCQSMLHSLLLDFQYSKTSFQKSHGEYIYHKYGLKGIRGEAMNGYPTLFGIGISTLRKCLALKLPLYKSARITLLYLIAYSEDTNIIIRSDYKTWRILTRYLQEYLHSINLAELDDEALIAKLDHYFLQKNISPGGSADLLALVYFLHFLSEFSSQKC